MNQQEALTVAYNPGNFSYSDWFTAHEKLKGEKPEDAAILVNNIRTWRAAQHWVLPVKKKRVRKKAMSAKIADAILNTIEPDYCDSFERQT